MNTQADEAAIRARTLLIALRATLECAADLVSPNDQIASAIFLTNELIDAVEKLASLPRPAND